MPRRAVHDSDDDESGEEEPAKRQRTDSAEEQSGDESADGNSEEQSEEDAPSASDADAVEGDNAILTQEVQTLRGDNYEKGELIKQLREELEDWKAEASSAAKKHDDVVREVQRLTEVDAGLRLELKRMRAKSNEGADGTTAIMPYGEGPREEGDDGPPVATHVLGPMRSLTALASGNQDFGLALLMPKNYNSTTVPYYFKQTGHHFPHRVQQGKSGTRQFVVESRILVQFVCKLVDRSNENKVCTEFALPAIGGVRFKLEVCYANTSEVVTCASLKTPPSSLLNPPESSIGEMRMHNGEIKWRFHAKFLSRNTRNPSGQEFFFKITCLNPELERFALNTDSVPFLVVSREVKPKGVTPVPLLAMEPV